MSFALAVATNRQLVKATLDAEQRPDEPWYTAGDEVTVSVRLDGDNVQNIKARKNIAVIEKVYSSGEDVANFYCVGVRLRQKRSETERLARLAPAGPTMIILAAPPPRAG